MTGYDINGFGYLKDGRGNICPATIILPTIAKEAVDDAQAHNKDIIKTFFEHLESALVDCRDELIERFNYIASQSASVAPFMWQNHTMAGYIPSQGIISALKHGTLGVGFVGGAECLRLLINVDQTTKKGADLLEDIMALMRRRCDEWKKEYKLNFGLYATPAESVVWTALKKFRDKYGVIKDVSDKEFFTNSTHVSVWKQISPFEKIDIESRYGKYCNGGHICTIELEGAVLHNIPALEQIVNYAMDADLPYFGINVPSDTCLDCGTQGLIEGDCPKCGSSNIERLRRVCGYLSTDIRYFNEGKKDEVRHRFKHSKKLKAI